MRAGEGREELGWRGERNGDEVLRHVLEVLRCISVNNMHSLYMSNISPHLRLPDRWPLFPIHVLCLIWGHYNHQNNNSLIETPLNCKTLMNGSADIFAFLYEDFLKIWEIIYLLISIVLCSCRVNELIGSFFGAMESSWYRSGFSCDRDPSLLCNFDVHLFR